MPKLKKYRVAVTEVYRKVITVLGTSERDAHRRAEDGWRNNEVILTEEDFEGAEYYVIPRPGDDQDEGKPAGDFVIQGYGIESKSEKAGKGTAKNGR